MRDLNSSLSRRTAAARRVKHAPAAPEPKRCIRVGTKGTPVPSPAEWDKRAWKRDQEKIQRATGHPAGPFDLHIFMLGPGAAGTAVMLWQDAISALQVFEDETQYRLGAESYCPSILFPAEQVEQRAEELRAAGFAVYILYPKPVQNEVVDIAAYKSRKVAWRCN